MQQYELTLIFKPELTPEQADDMIESLKVRVVHRQVWGKRFFSYPIDNLKEGLYMFLVVELDPKDISSLDRSVRFHDDIIRHLLVTAETAI